MLNINQYNTNTYFKKLLGYIIILNIFEFIYIFASHESIYIGTVLAYFPYIFILFWIYITISYLLLKKIAYQEELRQIKLELRKKDKRDYPRYNINKEDFVRVTFYVTVFKLLIKRRIKKTGRLMNISQGGMLIKLDKFHLVEGGKVETITTVFNKIKFTQTLGIVTRKDINKCAISFLNTSKKNRLAIQKYILKNRLKEVAD